MPEQQLKQPPLPAIPLARILQLRRDLSDWIAPRFTDVRLDTDGIQELTREIAAHMRGVPTQTISDSVGWMRDATPTELQLRELCWRLAGNYHTMRHGAPALPWRAPGVLEWCPVQVVRVAPIAGRRSDSRYVLECRVLAGTPAGLLTAPAFTLSHIYLLSELIGFTKRRGNRPLESPWQMVNMRFWALMDPTLVRFDEQPMFRATRATATHTAFNKTILDIRFRDSAAQCPRRFEHACHRCQIGYQHCAAATHRFDYQARPCPTCKQVRWYDPEVPGDECVACFRRRAVRSPH